MFKRFFLYISLVFLTIACKPEREQQLAAPATRLTTSLDNVRLRDAPGEEAKVLQHLPKGTVLYDLGEVSDFTTKVRLRGIELNEPWLKVRTESGTTGWVYGGVLNFTMNDSSELAKLLMQKRLLALFGQNLADRMAVYRQDFQKAASAADLAKAYRSGTTLRDSLVRLLQDKITVTDPHELPDLFWLEQTMPGFVPQLVAEGTAYYLFWNYKNLLQKAQATAEAADDDFVHLALAIYAEDSVEYFFPTWMIQTSDYGGSSLLGRGIHYQILQQLAETLRKSDLFEPEIRHWKTLLINDITGSYVTYWEQATKITAELDTILVKNYPILTDADKVALQTRRKQFDDPAAHKISVNQQTGD